MRRGILTIATVATLACFVPGAHATTGTTATEKLPPAKTVTTQEQRVLRSTPIARIIRQSSELRVPVAPTVGRREVPEGPDGQPLAVEGAPPATAIGGASATTTLAATATSQDGPWPGAYNQNPNRQIGWLFFDRDPGIGVDWTHCSATAINSENKSFVLTAGHCVYNPDPDGNGLVDGGGYYYQNFQFCPGYEFGCKLGVWTYRLANTTPSWHYGSGANHAYDWSDDMGVVLMKPSASGYLVNVVGGQGITFNQGTGLYRTAFGYPVTDPRWPQYSYSGEDLIYCQGTDWYDGYGHMAIPCTVTGGASGGPWIISPGSNWMGFVNSVNSHKPWGGTYEGGPYFGTAESNLFQTYRSS
jgi:hypothetical protein